MKASAEKKSKLGLSNTTRELLLFLLIPSLVIALVAAFLWLPSVFAKPAYDFIYSYCPEFNRCDDDFTVSSEGYVTQRQTERRTSVYTDYDRKTTTLYYHDTVKNATRQINIDEVKRYKLNTSSVSPDSYRLQRANGEGASGFLFWGDSGDYGWYLKNGAKKKKVDMASGIDYYSDSVNFLGWVDK